MYRPSKAGWVYLVFSLLVAVGLAWLFVMYPITRAERTPIGDTGLSFWVERRMDVDCTKEKYREGGWHAKLRTSQLLNYWASRAEDAERAASDYKDRAKHKLSYVATLDAQSYWTSAKYLKLELECYDLASTWAERPY